MQIMVSKLLSLMVLLNNGLASESFISELYAVARPSVRRLPYMIL